MSLAMLTIISLLFQIAHCSYYSMRTPMTLKILIGHRPVEINPMPTVKSCENRIQYLPVNGHKKVGHEALSNIKPCSERLKYRDTFNKRIKLLLKWPLFFGFNNQKARVSQNSIRIGYILISHLTYSTI